MIFHSSGHKHISPFFNNIVYPESPDLKLITESDLDVEWIAGSEMKFGNWGSFMKQS